MDEPDDYLFIAEELAAAWLRSRRGGQQRVSGGLAGGQPRVSCGLTSFQRRRLCVAVRRRIPAPVLGTCRVVGGASVQEAQVELGDVVCGGGSCSVHAPHSACVDARCKEGVQRLGALWDTGEMDTPRRKLSVEELQAIAADPGNWATDFLGIISSDVSDAEKVKLVEQLRATHPDCPPYEP